METLQGVLGLQSEVRNRERQQPSVRLAKAIQRRCGCRLASIQQKSNPLDAADMAKESPRISGTLHPSD